jgi:hypothetical protein
MEIPDQFPSLELNRGTDFEILEFHKASPKHCTPLANGLIAYGVWYIHAPSKNEKAKSQGKKGPSAPREKCALVRASAKCEGFSGPGGEYEGCGNESPACSRDSAKTG